MKLALPLILILAGLIHAPALHSQEKDSIAITHIANCGFMIEMDGYKIIIDGLFKLGHNHYTTPSPEIQKLLVSNQYPFNDIDLILVTHTHEDHFDSKMVLECMLSNPSVQLLCPLEVKEEIRIYDSIYHKVEARIIECTPSANTSELVHISNIEIHACQLAHPGEKYKNTQNIAYLISSKGKTVFHSADIDPLQIDKYEGVKPDEMNIDVGLINEDFAKVEYAGLAKSFISARHNIAMHLPKAAAGIWSDSLNDKAELYSNPFIFSKPLEKKVFYIDHRAQDQLPVLQKKGHSTQLLVDGIPFLILGGELGNSSATSMQYMEAVWPKLKAMSLNTILVPVFWELIEPEQGNFDFSLTEQLIDEARTNELKIIFLWFGSWKNSMSSHAPAWIKLNQEKYPRIKDVSGRSHEILTPFSEDNLAADRSAYAALMKFIKRYDSDEHTVIMMQVENEIGMLPTARDHHPLANKAFREEVPKELIKYMKENKKILVPELVTAWQENGFKTRGNWEEIFGVSSYTDEIFMAWYYSYFANDISEAGKMIYPLPVFVNAALNRPGREPGSGYPSAGPLPHLMDVWKAAGPSIDFLAPDFYTSRFKHWNDLYTRQGDPLFIPEHRFDQTAAPKALYAIAHYDALGFSPFSIESSVNPAEEPLGKVYNLLSQLTPLISSLQGQGEIEGVLFDKENQESIIQLGNYEFTFRHDYTLGWSPDAKQDEWPMTSAMIIRTGDDEFYLAGSGIVVSVMPLDKEGNAGILKTDEGRFENSEWIVSRHLNGDQTHQGRHLRIPVGEYTIQRFKLYTYN